MLLPRPIRTIEPSTAVVPSLDAEDQVHVQHAPIYPHGRSPRTEKYSQLKIKCAAAGASHTKLDGGLSMSTSQHAQGLHRRALGARRAIKQVVPTVLVTIDIVKHLLFEAHHVVRAVWQDAASHDTGAIVCKNEAPLPLWQNHPLPADDVGDDRAPVRQHVGEDHLPHVDEADLRLRARGLDLAALGRRRRVRRRCDDGCGRGAARRRRCHSGHEEYERYSVERLSHNYECTADKARRATLYLFMCK